MCAEYLNHSLVNRIKSELRSSSGISCDANGYVGQLTENLLPGVLRDHFESDLKHGGGHELERKFLALHSSSALAINTFATLKNGLNSLTIIGKSGFHSLVFENQLTTGLRGTPPNLDVYLRTDVEALGIESKFLEYFTPKAASFSNSYSRDRLKFAEDSWWKVLKIPKLLARVTWMWPS